MKWNKFTIKTTTQAEDFLSAMLDGLGIEGIEIENNVPLKEADMAKMFIDFLPQLPPDEGISYVSFYLEDGKDHSALLKQVMDGIEWQRQFMDVGEGSITTCDTEDIDWQNNWKSYFHAFSIENILIKPTWETLEREDRDKMGNDAALYPAAVKVCKREPRGAGCGLRQRYFVDCGIKAGGIFCYRYRFGRKLYGIHSRKYAAEPFAGRAWNLLCRKFNR